MEKLLLIAEKPSLMKDIKNTYELHKSEIPFKIDFVALHGHIYALKEPKDYEEWKDKKWYQLDLPLIPDVFETKTIDKETVKKIKEQLKNNYDGIIAAEDSDREGNYIHYLLEKSLNLKMKTYRLWLNEGLTDNLILKALLNMKDMHSDVNQKNLTNAAILRGRRDWLIGMNFTIAITLKRGEITHIGTVKSPTLKIIYDNCNEIDNFKEIKRYGIVAKHKDFSSNLVISQEESELKKFDTFEEANKYLDNLPSDLKVINYEKTIEKTYAPKLYKLSTLQVDMGKVGYSPQETLDIVQNLYEKHKLVSYPRTDCEYVTSDQAKDFGKLLNAAYGFNEFKEIIRTIKNPTVTNPKYVNDKKVSESSHTALIPTGKQLKGIKLTDKEITVLKAIYKRFVAIFLPPLVQEKTIIFAEGNNEIFKANGKITLEEGFLSFTGRKKEEELKLPTLDIGNIIHTEKYEVKEIISKPPARLTTATLINAMENASKFAKDKHTKDILKENHGIGTQATRASIIEDLEKYGYFITKGKSKAIYITEKGKESVKALGTLSLHNPEKIAELEETISSVSSGELDFKTAYINTLNYIKTTIKEINNSSITRAGGNNLKCPLCNKILIKNSKGYGCSGFKTKECNFFIGSIAKKQLTDNQIEKLLTKGKTEKIKGFTSKSGKKFDAILVLENGKVNFRFN